MQNNKEVLALHIVWHGKGSHSLFEWL